jgi:dual specificity tyrosine-phosphorylation-regulated kinase 2/3/4
MELLYTDIYTIIERRNCPAIPPDVVRRVTFQTLLCLRELWKLGIVHADIKPENILTNDSDFWQTKVADFGTACFTEQQIFSYIQSRYYRAPEVLYGLRYGPAIDMWSLGCVVYELLTGEPIFPAQKETELAEMIEICLGPPPTEIYKKGSKWNLFPRQKPLQKHDGIDSLVFMVASLPRVISKFIRGCLLWNPDDRFTPEQALASEWIMPEWELLRARKKSRLPPIHEPVTPRAKSPWHN